MALSRREREKALPSSGRITRGTSAGRRVDREPRRQGWQAVRRSPARGGDLAGGCPESARLREPPPAGLSNGNLAAVRHRPSVGPDAARAGPAVRLRCGAQL